MESGTPDILFRGPTSVIIVGTDQPLLNWVAYALASQTDPDFIWTDVRLPGQSLSPSDPLSRRLIPETRLNVVGPDELSRNEPTASVAISFMVRSDEPPVNIRRLVDFLRLPTQTQEVLARPRSAGVTRVVVLSNGHRVVAFYPSVEVVASTVHAIVETDSILIMTFADTPPEGRWAFDVVLSVEGSLPSGWRGAMLTVEKGPSSGPFRPAAAGRLGEFAPVAPVLAKELG